MQSRRWAPLCCALLVACFVADLLLRPGGVHLTRTIDDVAEMLAAFAASGAALWRAVHARHRTRTSWLLIAGGTGGGGDGGGIRGVYRRLRGGGPPVPPPPPPRLPRLPPPRLA